MINEIEQNPPGKDSGNEWVELYSSELESIEGWKLVNSDGDEYTLNGTINGYKTITFSRQWLDNKDENVTLIDSSGNTVDKTPIISDSYNDARSWNFCNGEWKFVNSTKGNENICSQIPSESSEESNQQEMVNEQSNQKQLEGEQASQEKVGQEERNSDSLSKGVKIEFVYTPTSMLFGELKLVKVKLISKDYYQNLLFFLYSPEDIVMDLNTNSVVNENSIDSSSSVKLRTYKNEEKFFSLPLSLVNNCDNIYKEGTYKIFLQGFFFDEGEWKPLQDLPNFDVRVTYNKDLCESSKAKVQDMGENSFERTRILYSSNTKTIKRIGLWILIATTLLLFILIWKKKLI